MLLRTFQLFCGSVALSVLPLHMASAELVTFGVSADDFATLTIDGSDVLTVDSIAGASDSIELDLTPGPRKLGYRSWSNEQS